MTTYTRKATCSKGHKVEVNFVWNPDETKGAAKDYLEPRPASGCDGSVAGTLPIGTDANSLKLTER